MEKLLRCLIAITLTYSFIVVALGVVYLFVPPVSTLMLARWATLQSVSYKPVSLRNISPHLQRMVIRAEDSRFCRHYGVDWDSMLDTIEDGGLNGPTRGASTIPMQVAKNLFLWPQQSYIRKAIEIPIAIYLTVIWPKPRMLEVYLSIAEWGDGIYGVEAAAQSYFHKSASALTAEEASLLATALPNPKQRNPNHPSAYHSSYAQSIQKWANNDVDMSCLH